MNKLHFHLPIYQLPKPQQGLGSGNRNFSLPTRLHNAGNLPLQSKLAKTDAAQIELAQIPAGPAAALAASVGSHRKFWFSSRFRNQ